MLKNSRNLNRQRPIQQRGVVLMITLIVLVGMTLAALVLVRSVDTANLIAGNMAFQQAATQAGDKGTEAAITWLETNNAGNTLWATDTGNGYYAARQDPAAGQTWDDFWAAVFWPPTGGAGAVTLPQDSAGNTVSYVIQRLCNGAGDPVSAAGLGSDCAVSPAAGTSAGSSKGAGVVALLYNSQVYYRITSRIAGPRNTVSFVQAIVAL